MSAAPLNPIAPYVPKPEPPSWACSCERPLKLRMYLTRWVCICGKLL